ncbi:hypothetical protein [Metabacillus fastidiosus]|uniref:hypothetical protein n=1 Tax=Metabacillus fastidiosus TaxID=1458 RepID=UPI003D2D3AB1
MYSFKKQEQLKVIVRFSEDLFVSNEHETELAEYTDLSANKDAQCATFNPLQDDMVIKQFAPALLDK